MGGGEGILQGITVYLVSKIFCTICDDLVIFETVSRGQVLVFFNKHCTTMHLVKEMQGGLIPKGLKRRPFRHLLQVQQVAVL